MDKLNTSHGQFVKQSSDPSRPLVSVLLRGVNLSSSSKFPRYDLSKDIWSEAAQGGLDGWFVDHPLPEQEFDFHLSRLSSWGFNIIRLVVTWEALEPLPGKYNEMYISYLIKLLYKCKQYGLRVCELPHKSANKQSTSVPSRLMTQNCRAKIVISAHQDMFSRFTGGSGAPIWTLEAMGLAPRRIHNCCAALLHHLWDEEGYGGQEGRAEASNGDLGLYPDMLWNTNLHRLASRHCFTMFFASHVFAPKCIIDGMHASQWLQARFIEAYGHLADSIPQDLFDSCLIGWDTINEPHEGFIGIPNLNEIPPTQEFRKGPSPSPLQSFQLGVGQSVGSVAYDDFTSLGHKKLRSVRISPDEGVWMTKPEKEAAEQRYGWKWGSEWEFWDHGGCPWAGHGVWSPSLVKVLQPRYFDRGTKGDNHGFVDDFLRPHHEAYIRRIRRAHPDAIVFLTPPVFAQPPRLGVEETRGRVAISPHFYDGLTMLGKRRHKFNANAVGLQRGQVGILGAVKFGTNSIRAGLTEQLRELKDDGRMGLAEDSHGTVYPAIIGETGVPFDMKPTGMLGLARGKRSPRDYKEPTKAMDELLDACDGSNALSYTLWNYEPRNDSQRGDNWNGEDLSIVSLNEAGRSVPRGMRAWCRPYPVETTGAIKKFTFDMSSTIFALTIELYSQASSSLCRDPTWISTEGYAKIYLPFVHYGRRVVANDDLMDDVEGPAAGVNDIQIIEISQGRFVAEGQWGWWYYSLESDREITLRICKSKL